MESVFDTYRTDPEKTYEFGAYYDGNNAVIRIAKAGGGTIGKAYHGNWLAQLTNQEGTIFNQTHELRSELPKTHKEMARIYADLIRLDLNIPEEMREDLAMFAMGMWE